MQLLGGVEGQGFKQLMETFEIRAHPDRGARDRRRPMRVRAGAALRQGAHAVRQAADLNFPRVADKLAMMAVEIHIARQITYFAARAKDAGRRCDLEAGMAKLLGARVAWAAADNALQIHGGNGFALEYPISPRAVRRAHPQHFRGRGGDPGAGDREAVAGGRELGDAIHGAIPLWLGLSRP